MKVQLNMEKPTIITTDVVSQDRPSEKSDKKSANVKVIVIAVAAVCVAVTVVAGFVFAFKFQAKTTSDIITRTIEARGQTETIEENRAENTKLYTIQAEGETQQVLYDFNRKLRLIKADGRCFVSPMNATEKDVEEMTSEENGYVYSFDSQPVHDKSFLSKTGQDLCESEHVYWAFQNCGDEANNGTMANKNGHTGIEKRQTYRLTCFNCCMTSCGRTVCGCIVQRVLVCYGSFCRCYFLYRLC